MDGLTMYYNMGDLTDKTLEIIDGFLAHMISLIQAALDVTSINASIKGKKKSSFISSRLNLH